MGRKAGGFWTPRVQKGRRVRAVRRHKTIPRYGNTLPGETDRFANEREPISKNLCRRYPIPIADSTRTFAGLLYRAPELLRSRGTLEPTARDYQRGDVYSFGIVLYELQGRHGPFGITESSDSEILKKIIAREPELKPFRYYDRNSRSADHGG